MIAPAGSASGVQSTPRDKKPNLGETAWHREGWPTVLNIYKSVDLVLLVFRGGRRVPA